MNKSYIYTATISGCIGVTERMMVSLSKAELERHIKDELRRVLENEARVGAIEFRRSTLQVPLQEYQDPRGETI